MEENLPALMEEMDVDKMMMKKNGKIPKHDNH